MKKLTATIISCLILTAIALAEPQKDSDRKALGQKAFESRMSYAKSADYEPYSIDARESANKAWKLIDQKKYKEAIVEADSGLKSSRFSIPLLRIKAIAYHELGNLTESEKLHDEWVSIADSILDYGDGRSFETAFTVISVDEEYDVLGLLGLESTGQALVTNNGKSFDRLEVRKRGSEKKTISLFFNVDLPIEFEKKQFEGLKSK